MLQYSEEQVAFVARWSRLDCLERGVYHDSHMVKRRSGRTTAVLKCISQMLLRDPNTTITFYTPRRDAHDRFLSLLFAYGYNVHVIVVDYPHTDLDQYDAHSDVTFIHHLPVRPCPHGGRILYVGSV